MVSEYEENEKTLEKTFIGTVAKALGAKRHNSKSEYATFETKNGHVVTIRLADPIAVFDNYQLDGNRTILTELQSKGKNIMVAVTLGKDGVDVDFNIISSVFGKGENNIVDWLNKGYARYINKAKALDYLHHSDRNISEALRNPKLVSAAKVVEDFENPSIPSGNVEELARRWQGCIHR